MVELQYPGYSQVRELSRDEIERHQKRFTGITVSAPGTKVIGEDENGDDVTEYVCDVRVGFVESWAIIRDVLVNTVAYGIIADKDVPVLMERNEAGRVSIIGRSRVALPGRESSNSLVFSTYTYADLDFVFMAELTLTGGLWKDGYGHLMASPQGVAGVSYRIDFICDVLDWNETDADDNFDYGTDQWGQTSCSWNHLSQDHIGNDEVAIESIE